jgi:hypothetical protein
VTTVSGAVAHAGVGQAGTNGSPGCDIHVEVVAWPVDAEEREALAEAGRPRLLLVEAGMVPPTPPDCFEDWVRVPAGEEEVKARIAALRLRVAHHRRDAPVLDREGCLRMGERWVHLPPIEARLAGALLERFGTVVGPSTLLRAGWPGGTPSRNTLDVRIHRLRRRLEPLGLGLRTVRRRGWILEVAPGSGGDGAHRNGH